MQMLAISEFKMKPYIDPDSLVGFTLTSSLLGGMELGFELSYNESKHVLATTEENAARGVVGTGLFLVKTLERILLGSLSSALVRFDKGRVKKEDE